MFIYVSKPRWWGRYCFGSALLVARLVNRILSRVRDPAGDLSDILHEGYYMRISGSHCQNPALRCGASMRAKSLPCSRIYR